MLRKHHAVLNQLTSADHDALRRGLALDATLPLVAALEEGRYDQADVVLTLLHAGRHTAVQLLVGRPIIVFAAQRSPHDRQMDYERLVLRSPQEAGDQRKIQVSVPTCPLRIPTAVARWELMAACRTVQAYLSRVPRWRALRDLREWGAAGWLVLT